MTKQQVSDRTDGYNDTQNVQPDLEQRYQHFLTTLKPKNLVLSTQQPRSPNIIIPDNCSIRSWAKVKETEVFVAIIQCEVTGDVKHIS